MTEMAESAHRVPRSRRGFVPVLSVAAAVAVALLLRRCLPGPGPGPGSERTCASCPASSLPPEPACGAAAPRAPARGVPTNGLAAEALDVGDDVKHNGLDPAAVPGNRDLLAHLAAGALTPSLLTASRDPAAWRALLARPYALDLLEYVVSCALDPEARVDLPSSWDELAPARRRAACALRGQLGLCGQTYRSWAAGPGAAARAGEAKPTTPAGSADPLWSEARPADACLERVSACVLARVNAVGARVPISLRGDGVTPLDQVPVQTQYRENHGTPIQSFGRCDRLCLRGDPLRRNCDWAPRFVGQCVRDGGDGGAPRQVHLRIAARGPVRVRICRGIYGCDDTAPAPGAGAATAPVMAGGHLVELPAAYGGQLVLQSAARPGEAIAFECPDNGPLEPAASGTLLRTGYYSVMLGTLAPAVALAPADDVALAPAAAGAGEPFATHDRYPAPEAQVFTYREGGFYGSIFESAARGASSASGAGQEYACASEIWHDPAPASTERFCAGGSSAVSEIAGCFANPPGTCDAPRTAPLCAPASGPARGYDRCAGGDRSWEQPYATYLNHPCDLFATDEQCLRFLDPRIAKLAAPRAAPPRYLDRAPPPIRQEPDREPPGPRGKP